MNEATLQHQCAEVGLSWVVQVLTETSSTNDVLREEGRRGAVAGKVVFAEKQTAGRGRRDHVWDSVAGQDLVFSLALQPQVPMAKWTRVTQLTALAVCRAVETEMGLQLAIKWPNDLMVDNKKVCGILVESFGGKEGGFLVVGVGLNVNASSFAGVLGETATSLRLACDAEWVRERGLLRQGLALRLLMELERCLAVLGADEAFYQMMEKVRERNWLAGKRVKLIHEGQEKWGQVTGLDDEGALLLRLPDGEEVTVMSAEQVRAI